VYINICVDMYIYTCIYMYIIIYMCICSYVYVCACICVRACMRIYIYMHPQPHKLAPAPALAQKVSCRYSTEKETHVRPSERVIRRNKSLIRLTGSPLAEVRKKRSGEKRCQKRLTTYFNKNLQTSKDTNATDIRELVWYDCGTENTAKLSYIHQKESTM